MQPIVMPAVTAFSTFSTATANPIRAHAPIYLPLAHGAPHPARPARSRSTNFWILPVEVFGSGPKTTCAAP